PFAGRQTVSPDANPSGGQLGPVPEQNSARSHGPFAGRQSVSPDANPSGGQLTPPRHTSATSQRPFASRHTTPVRLPSTHLGSLPEHMSGRSQSPALSRQVVPGGAN